MSLHLYLEITRSLGIKEPDPPSGLGLSSWFDVSGLAESQLQSTNVAMFAHAAAFAPFDGTPAGTCIGSSEPTKQGTRHRDAPVGCF